MKTTVTFDASGPIGRIILTPSSDHRPPVLDHDVLDELDAAIAEAAAEESARVVIVESASDRFFCAGADIAVLETLDRSTIGSWIAHGHAVLSRLERLPMPTVAVVAGYALGGGLELALACDLVFATSDARFGQTEVRLGFVTGFGGGRRLAGRVGPGRSKLLSFSGRQIGAEAAYEWGIADVLGSPADVAEVLDRFVEEVELGSAEAIAAQKRVIDQSWMRSGAVNAALESEESLAIVESPETVARVTSFLDARKRKRSEDE